MPTITIYGDASDGWLTSNSTDLTSARNGTNLTAYNDHRVIVGGLLSGSMNYYYQGFLAFDTSTIPETPSNASLQLCMHGDETGGAEFTVEVYGRDYGAGVPTAGDWMPLAAATFPPKQLTWNTSANPALGSYVTFSDMAGTPAPFAAGINRTGFSRYVLASSRWRIGNVPSVSEWVGFYSGDAAGTTQDPKLIITYSIPEGAAALNGSGDLFAVGSADNGSASLTGTGDLSAEGTYTAIGAAALTGTGDLTAFASLPVGCAALGYGGAWYGGTTVYGGFGMCDAIQSLAPLPAEPNVLEISHAVGRLGCGVASFFITSRCAGVVTCVLDGIVSDGKWDRKLDDVSKAEVTVSLSGDSSFTCGECLEETEPWCHELHIWRDGEEVWVGPIQEIEYTYNEVTIRASDSLAWLGVRVPIVDIDHRTVAADLTTMATALLTMSYALDSPNTCELDNLYAQATGTSLKLFYEKYNQTALEILRDLSDLGLNFTTLGRTIVLVGDHLSLTPLVLLNDEHILGDVIVTKNGTLQGNRYFVHFEEDGGVPVVGEATNFYCYSDIERIRDGDGLTDGVSAGQVADAYAAASAIAPRTIEIPAASQLSPDTPWTINQMVPGARVDVAISRLPISLTQSFLLTEVEATYNDRDGESIGITLTPINNSAVV